MYLELKKVFELEKRVEQERDEKLKAKTEIETLEKRLQEFQSPNTAPNEDQANVSTKQTFSIEEEEQAIDAVNSLIELHSLDSVKFVFDQIIIGNAVYVSNEQNQEILSKCISKGIIQLSKRDRSDYNIYTLTKLGEKMIKQASWNI